MRAIYENIPAVSIFLMMFAGILTTLCKKGGTAYIINQIAHWLVLIMSLVLLRSLMAAGDKFVYSMGALGAPWGNELRAGPLEAFLACVFTLVMLLCVWGGHDDARADILPEKQSLYFIMLDLCMASLLAIIYTNDIFTAYVFIEINTITACALVMAKDEARTVAATVRYLIMSLVGSSLFLFSVALLYGITGQLLMESLAPVIAGLMEQRRYVVPLAALTAMISLGLCIKGALYPFSSWLPGAHGTATNTSSAVLSGLVIKVYVILLIKIYVRCFGLESIRSMGLPVLLFALGIAAMIMGSVKAMGETHMKRMIAYSSVAQVGYIFMAIGMGTEAGIVAALYQLTAHAVTKPLIFLSAGGLSNASGHCKQIQDMRGSAVKAPLAGVGFTLGGLALTGIPLLGSFAAKMLIAGEAAANPGWQTNLALVALAVSGVLNALYYLPAIMCVWSPRKDQPAAKSPVEPGFALSVLILSVGVVLLGVYYAPLARLLDMGVKLF